MENIKITLEEAFKVLEECSALSMEDGELLYPSFSDLEGSDEHEFAYFEWVNDEGLIFSAKFAEGENQSVTVVSNLMTLVDVEGEEVTFYVLGPMVIKDFLSSQPTSGSALRKAAQKEMVSNDTPMTRVEYLIASINDVSETCSERGYFGACAMLDNLYRIANDVKLSISQNA